jgi:prolyl-tRNA editing enzyme YbaK/EbsC (Cys-tRNA(Pro) deacylase)
MPTPEQVKAFLAEHDLRVLEFDEETPTSEAAARALGCSVGEIAKTILFLVGSSPVVVLASGDVRAQGGKLKRSAGLSGRVRLPGPDEVLRYTGYPAGGVCPFLLPPGLPILVDRSLERFPIVYPAAGSRRSAVAVPLPLLRELTHGAAAAVCD